MLWITTKGGRKNDIRRSLSPENVPAGSWTCVLNWMLHFGNPGLRPSPKFCLPATSAFLTDDVVVRTRVRGPDTKALETVHVCVSLGHGSKIPWPHPQLTRVLVVPYIFLVSHKG